MLLKYEDLKPCVFVPLREIGNTLAFIRMLDSAQVCGIDPCAVPRVKVTLMTSAFVQRRLSMHTRSLVLPFVQSPGAGSGATGAGAGSGGPSGPIRDILGAVAGSTPPASSSAADPAHHGVARTADGRPIKSAFTMLSLQVRSWPRDTCCMVVLMPGVCVSVSVCTPSMCRRRWGGCRPCAVPTRAPCLCLALRWRDSTVRWMTRAMDHRCGSSGPLYQALVLTPPMWC